MKESQSLLNFDYSTFSFKYIYRFRVRKKVKRNLYLHEGLAYLNHLKSALK